MRFTLTEMLRLKQESRARRATQTVAEKLRVLEQLRERDRAIRTATLPKPPVAERIQPLLTTQPLDRA